MSWHSRERIERAYWNRKIPVGASVFRFERLLRIPVYVGPGFFSKYQAFRRRHIAISHPPVPYFDNQDNLPEIEITIDCDSKDLSMILNVIRHAEQNVKNPISKIDVVVPLKILKLAQQIIDAEIFSTTVRVVDEDKVLPQALRAKIKGAFPHRYGWVLHQFLTLQQILNCSKQGILSIDSDTLILRPMAFLNSEGVQVLMESLEYHKPYYEFLNKIDSKYPVVSPSHVTHYSFFQRDIFLFLLKEISVKNLDEFFAFVEKFADKASLSPFCVDREFYAIGMRQYCPSRFTLVKFANISVLPLDIDSENKILELAKKYNSVSAHHYLQSGGH